MTSNPVDQWPAQLWDDINNAAKIEAGKVRIAPKVFPTVTCDDNPTEVIDDVIATCHTGVSIHEYSACRISSQCHPGAFS